MPGCGSCPDFVKAVLRARVSQDLRRVRAIKAMTGAFNEALTGLIDRVDQDELDVINNNIPGPFSLTPSDVVNLFLCPLFPLALLEDPTMTTAVFSNADSDYQLSKVKDMFRKHAQQVGESYDNALKNTKSYEVTSIADRYMSELKRINLNASNYARSVIICATIIGLSGVDDSCAKEYQEGPYNEFSNEISTFAFTGLYPAGFDRRVSTLINRVAVARNKIELLKNSSAAI